MKYLNILIALPFIVITFFFPGSAYAISENDYNAVIKNTIFYDPNAECNTTGQGTRTAADPGLIYVLGDSIANGARAQIAAGIDGGGYSTHINAVIGRPLAADTIQTQVAANAAERQKMETATGVVIELGANNLSNSNFIELINSTIAEIRVINSTARIYWVDVGSNADGTNKDGQPSSLNVNTGTPAVYSANNRAIYSQAAVKQYTVIPWYKTIFGENADPQNILATAADTKNLLSNDELHPSPAGNEALAGIITEIVKTNTGSPGSTGTLSTNVPAIWRNLILSVSGKYPNVDPRLVAAVLWVENRGWPEYKTSGWAESGAGARGPWQFIPQTWFGWNTGITSWGRVNDNSAYSSTGMGRDGDGDGFRNPDNPRDAVESAYVHMEGSAGKPIMDGYPGGGDPQQAFNTIPFQRNRQNLLSFAASYNGNGAPNGVTLSNFGNSENQAYVKMSFWLLATDFDQGWTPNVNFVDAKTTGALFGSNTDPTGVPGPVDETGTCSDESSTATVNADGYAFPLEGTKAQVKSGYTWPCPNLESPYCHHDASPAFDLSHQADDSSTGLNVFAIYPGTIKGLKLYKGIEGCYAFQLVGDDGFQYWHGHVGNVTVANEQRVTAGQQIAEIGARACTGNGSYPHLHIDRGSPKGEPGGSDCCRDPGFVPLINALYDALPEG